MCESPPDKIEFLDDLGILAGGKIGSNWVKFMIHYFRD